MHVARTARLMAAATVLAAALTLTACTAPQGAADDASGDGPRVVEIALAVPLTSGDTDAGQDMLRAAELAVADVNNASEIEAADLQIVLKVVDDKDDLETAFDEAGVIVADERVLGVVGHPSSDVTLFVSSVYDDAGMPFIAVASSPLVTERGYETIARILPREDAVGALAAEIADSQMEATSALVVDDGTFRSSSAADAFDSTFVSQGGIVLERTSLTGQSVQAVASRVAALMPSTVFISASTQQAAMLSIACDEAGSDALLIAEGACERSDYLTLAGASAEGDIGVRTAPDLGSHTRGRDFLAYFETTYGYEPRTCAAYAYDGIWVLVRAALEVGVDRTAVSRALRTMEFSGVTGTMRFDERGDTTNLEIVVARVVDGTWQTIP